MKHFCVLGFLLALLLPSVTPTGAEEPTILLVDPPQGSLYLGPGRMLDAATPRQMSLNAHITQFLYQPGGLSIAALSAVPDDSVLTETIALIGLKRGEAMTLLRHGSTDEPGFTTYIMRGWTADGRYLFVTADLAVASVDSPEPHFRPVIYCIDVGATPVQIRSLALSLPPPSKDIPYANLSVWWPPSRGRLLIEQYAVNRRVPAAERVQLCALYNPVQDKSTTFSLPTGESVRGWLDEGHLLLTLHTDALHFFSWDIAAGTQTEIPRPAKMPEGEARDSDSVSPKSPALSLDVEQRFHPDKQGVTGINSHLLWLRRLGLPKALSALPVGLTPGNDDPLAVWSPTGKQIAFVDHGDLFVTDLTEREATPKERYLAGEKLTCPEERQVAMDALKQIGLGIIQYAQDNDEQYPALTGVIGSIRPYLPPNALLSVGGHPFLYHAPSNLSLASIDDPAHTVLGTIDLPCAVVTLFADGHVMSPPK